MQKSVCIIDFSGTEIRIGMLIDDQFESIDLNLPWKVGFRQETDGTLVACFGKAFKRLDSNDPAEVRFTELDVHFKDITDEKTLGCLFSAFFEEIFHRLLPVNEYPTDAVSVFVITPYQWKPLHRQQLRSALRRIENVRKRIERNVPFIVSSFSHVTLRGMFSQILCLTVYHQKAWEDILTTANKLYLFLIDFTRHDLILYHLVCEQSADCVKAELCDILRFPAFFRNTKKMALNVQSTLQKVEDNLPVAVVFSGKIDDPDAKYIIELLKSGGSATFLDMQANASLIGGAELIQQFERNNIVKPLHFVYHYCFGVRLPDGKWVELVPKTQTPPYHRKKAFHFTGLLEKFDISLFCGLSLTDNSDVHRLTALEIDYPDDNDVSSRKPPEFILSITLNDSFHGIFAVQYPNSSETRSVEFKIPVLME